MNRQTTIRWVTCLALAACAIPAAAQTTKRQAATSRVTSEEPQKAVDENFLNTLRRVARLEDSSTSRKPELPRVEPPKTHAQENAKPSRGVSPLMRQTAEEALAKSYGCQQCHTGVGDMHNENTMHLGCTDCHGGNASANCKEDAHVSPRFPELWASSANPVRSYTLLNHEHNEFVRFVNPGDLRVARQACGECHAAEVLEVQKSMMTHGCMLWSAALYNNGAVPNKIPRFGESYSANGAPQRMQTVWPPSQYDRIDYDIAMKGVVPFLDPMPRFEVTHPGNILRYFERGGRFRPETGVPERGDDPGRTRVRLSSRGPGTENRTDPVFIGLQKTRLLDPTLNFLGTNDHPGDYRSSGCTACHVTYANDRSPVHSGPFARFGNGGLAASTIDDPSDPNAFVRSIDPCIPKNEPGHPITHRFTMSAPTSQCIVCHIHPGTNVLNSYLGYMWWDNETDGRLMYPREQKRPTAEEEVQSLMSNPEMSAARGNWSDPAFLHNLPDLNRSTKHTQFADFHGHGWAFRAVFKKDREGRMLDHQGVPVSEVSNDKLVEAVEPPTEAERVFGKRRDDTPVHLMDVHLERGMHCSDCHFNQDSHGNTKLYGEVRAAIEITCTDCHGSANESIPERLRKGGRMLTSGPAAPDKGTDLMQLRTPFTPRKPRFEVRRMEDPRFPGKSFQALVQHSAVHPDREWIIMQTADTLDPKHPHYNAKSHAAKTVRWSKEGDLTWGGKPSARAIVNGETCAHRDENMSCQTCHSAWNPSCFGCHLPQKANRKMPSLHFEGDISRNLVEYNFQTLRDDVYMIAKDGVATGNRVNPARSSCAIHVTSYNNNRESIYAQQQTVSAEGFSGIAFSTNVPHTVRGRSGNLGGIAGASETKTCSDCHLSKEEDNNALMAQLLMQGTNFTNFIGKYCWVAAEDHGLEAIVVTESTEPQAVYGSTLHSDAYPEDYHKFVEEGRALEHRHEHPGIDILQKLTKPTKKAAVKMVQARGEYLYAACGEDGLRVFDIAMIDHKGFSERITTAPVSPLGQRFYVKTPNALAVAAPTTLAPDPTRQKFDANREQSVHPLYAYIYVADSEEGLVMVSAATLLDGDPTNNFLEKDIVFNPDNVLHGARFVNVVGEYAHVLCDAGWVIISLSDPKCPRVVNVIGHETLECPTNVQIQFRYAFVTDHHGLNVFDVTDPERPEKVALVELHDAHNVYVARNYAYVAGGHQGLVIVDVTRPREPRVDQIYNANGCINDLHDVKLGITYASLFAYLADGHNGLHVVQLTSPDTPGSTGFSARPYPRLIATKHPPKGGHFVQVSEGLDRDRAVDESGNQLAVFGRLGARPLNRQEQEKMYLRPRASEQDLSREVWRVSDDPFDRSIFQFPAELKPAESARRPTGRLKR